jgi:hypothetical protein
MIAGGAQKNLGADGAELKKSTKQKEFCGVSPCGRLTACAILKKS